MCVKNLCLLSASLGEKKHLEAWLRPSAAAVGGKKIGPPLENFRPPPLGEAKGGLGPSLNEKACRGMNVMTN